MVLMFIISLLLVLFIFCIRLLLSLLYISNNRSKKGEAFNEKMYTVLQPILSGDPLLEETLLSNLARTRELRFFWLIDRDDSEAIRISDTILKREDYRARVRVLYIDQVPQGINPKSYKLKHSISDMETDYIIVLDDDSVIDFENMAVLNNYETMLEEVIVTGIPYNYGNQGFFSKLLAAFVNANSYISYFSMAYLKANQSINGMFYIVSTNLVRKYDLFEAVEPYLCDDLAVADYLSSKGVRILQSTIGVNVRTSMNDINSYLRIMHRWLLFSRIYFKKHFSISLFLLIILPNVLIFMSLLSAILLGWKAFATVVVILLFKAMMMYAYRSRVIEKPQCPSMVYYEFLNDIILFPVFVYSAIKGNKILWRDKWIRVSDGKINYEDAN